MLDWYPPTSDDAGPTAKVGGEPPGRVWGSGVPPGTLWMVLRGWSKKKVARAVPFVRRVRRPTTPGLVFGHVAERARLVDKKKKGPYLTPTYPYAYQGPNLPPPNI